MTKPILVWFGFTTVVRYQTLFLEEAKDIFKFLSGTLQSKGPLKISPILIHIHGSGVSRVKN